MKLKFLKKVRVVASLTFFLAFTVIFLDLSYAIPEILSGYVIYFQFIPSFLKFITVGTLAASGFIIATVLTLLFGRVYCSFLCPLGILQDIIAFLRKKTKKFKYIFIEPWIKTRYGILAGVMLLFFSGSIMGLTLFDPYSNFGRITTHVFRPVAVGMNNALSFTLAKFNVYAIHPVEFKGIALFSFVFAVVVFGVVLWMSFYHGRLYCNTVCPVGTLLGFLSRFSIFKIRFNPSECISCKACERVCKAGCMDVENSEIDFSRCVACFNCFKVCPTEGVVCQWGLKKHEPTALPEDVGKRDFIMQTAAFLMASGTSVAGAQQPVEIYKESTVSVLRKSGVTPPGSLSLDHFMNKCTACHLCVSACPTQVLQPAFLEYGFLGIMQPRMDYKTSYCNYDCVACSAVCPSGAILAQDLEGKKLIQLGKAKFVKKNCVVYSQKTDCGACAEHCPTKAVRMVLDKEVGKRAPKIDESICIGCGACEFACPTKPYKAIYVENNPVHAVAKKPEEEEIKEEVDLKEDFPF